MKVLGIETSCDETGVAIYDTDAGLLAHGLHSQIDLHAAYGGVVPELASRDHIRRLPVLLKQTLAEAGLRAADVDAVAYTSGPGLAGALLVGASVAESFAMARGIPALPVHHLEGRSAVTAAGGRCAAVSFRRAARLGGAHPAHAGAGGG